MPLARVFGQLFDGLVDLEMAGGGGRVFVLYPRHGARVYAGDTRGAERGDAADSALREDTLMGRYISLVTYTDQGIRNIKESPKRLDAAKKLLKDLGGELKEFYLTMGGYDIVIVAEAPNDEVVAKFTLAAGSLGNVRTTTLKAFTEAEFRKIVATLP